ncbi:MAG: hypothetical protein QNJ71_06675 [Acidimicrobiia bacterium]|nr:hypothetical protein [Acidimicrobiia bacterium]
MILHFDGNGIEVDLARVLVDYEALEDEARSSGMLAAACWLAQRQ